MGRVKALEMENASLEESTVLLQAEIVPLRSYEAHNTQHEAAKHEKEKNELREKAREEATKAATLKKEKQELIAKLEAIVSENRCIC